MARKPKGFIVLFLFFVLEANAQRVPGYLGKRFMAGYELSFHPVIGKSESPVQLDYFVHTNFSGKRTGMVNKSLFFEGEHKIRAGFVATRSMVLLGNFGISRMGFKATANDQNDEPFREIPFKVSSFNFGLEMNIFMSAKRGVAAPYGSFLRLAFHRCSGRILFGDSEIPGFENEFISRWSGNIFSTGFGVNKIIGKQIVLNFGADMKFILVNDFLPDPDNLPSDYLFYGRWRSYIQQRLNRFYRFNLSIGISGLLF